MLNDYTSDELQNELERREKKRKIPKQLPEEEVRENLYNVLKEGVRGDVKLKLTEGYYPKDTETYTWESVIQAFYGYDIFDILNE